MNGDWIAQDVEPDICCSDTNIGCTCELESIHYRQIRNNGLKAINIGWDVDEIRAQVTSKIGFPDDPAIYLFTTTQTSEGSWLHSFHQY